MVLKRAYGRLISLHYELKLHLEIRFSLLLMMISIYISCCLFRKQCHVQTRLCHLLSVCERAELRDTHVPWTIQVSLLCVLLKFNWLNKRSSRLWTNWKFNPFLFCLETDHKADFYTEEFGNFSICYILIICKSSDFPEVCFELGDWKFCSGITCACLLKIY